MAIDAVNVLMTYSATTINCDFSNIIFENFIKSVILGGKILTKIQK